MSISLKENLSKVKNWVDTITHPNKDLRHKYITDIIEPTYYPTPNPHSMKFVLNVMLSYEGKSTYRSAAECEKNPLALGLLEMHLPQDTQHLIANVHFFQNTITITKQAEFSWDVLIPMIEAYLIAEIPYHNANFESPDPEALRRKGLSKELLEIEEILDKSIRSGLQADGGDVTCIDFQNDVLLIKYVGACGSCPSSSTGTLEAIKHILTEALGRSIDVFIAPSSGH